MALSTGSSLGSYQILGHLGSGGMGEVYRAKDTKLGRELALKVLPEAFARDPDRIYSLIVRQRCAFTPAARKLP